MDGDIDHAVRQTAALRACAAFGAEALLVGSMGSGLGMNTQAQGYMRFLAGWDSVDTPTLLLLRRGWRPTLFVASPHMAMLAAQMLAHADIAVQQAAPTAFGDALARSLAQQGGMPARIGLCGCDELPAAVWAGVAAALAAAETVAAEAPLARLRLVKDAAQLALHRQGAAICDRMFARLREISLLGRPSYAIKADLDHVAWAAGADMVRSWLTVGPQIDYPRYFPAENRQVPAVGDVLMFGVMVTVEGVWSHAVRSFHIGPAPVLRHRIQDAVVEAQRRIAASLRPGRDLAQVAREAYGLLDPAYDAIGTRDVRLLRLGHGLGYAYADPVLSDAFPRSFQDEAAAAGSIPLAPGMVFELHPLLLFAGGGAGVGDTLVVGTHGGEFLTAFPRALQELPA